MRRVVFFTFLLLGAVLADEVNLTDLQRSIYPLVQQARKTTVAVNALGSTGSGVVVSASGLVLTAGHVVTDLDTGAVADVASILFEDGEEVTAKVLGMNRRRDAAMLQLQGEGPWVFSPLGNSAAIRPGDWVVATGHPSGYDALRASPVRFGRVISKMTDYFFGSDCVLFGGDSGGPLFDLEGQVVGIHSWIGTDVQTNTHAGISGFLEDWEQLKAGVRWEELRPPPGQREGKPALGVIFHNELGQRGVKLDAVLAESAAEVAGLRAGDIVQRVDGQPTNPARFRTYLQNLKAGDEVVLDILRGQEQLITRVKLDRVGSLPFVTERGQNQLKAQALRFFKAFGEVTDELGNGVVRLFADGTAVAFGTVWNGNRVLAKWSELKGAEVLVAQDSDQRELGLEVMEIFAAHDLVLLRLPPGMSLRTITASNVSARAGTLIAAVRQDGVPEGVGVISVSERSLLESSRGFLGVVVDDSYKNGGALIRGVTAGSAAAEAGLREADVIWAVNGRQIDSFEELRTVLSRAGADQIVNLSVRRRTGPIELVARLKGKEDLPQLSSRRERMMDQVDERGLSTVRDGFPSVLQTDMTIAPEESGLPVVDIEGRLIGIVIARAGRVSTYLLPVATIADLVDGE